MYAHAVSVFVAISAGVVSGFCLLSAHFHRCIPMAVPKPAHEGWVDVSIIDWGPWLNLIEGFFDRLPIGLWRRRWYLIMACSVQISRA